MNTEIDNNIFSQEINEHIRCISHEIRNNLSICEMYSQIIKKNLEKDGVKNPSIDNALECIRKSIQIIGSNVMELKSTSCNTFNRYDFEQLILKGIELSKAYVEDKNITFEVFIKNSATIYADENRFISCVVNIIKNGIEAINIKGKISVLAEVKNQKAVLKISNNGKPIPKSKQEEIFLAGYTNGKKNGNGLGLHICKQYLKSQNATLKLLKSTTSETQFEISIPVFPLVDPSA